MRKGKSIDAERAELAEKLKRLEEASGRDGEFLCCAGASRTLILSPAAEGGFNEQWMMHF